jgi:hypothetical protein
MGDLSMTHVRNLDEFGINMGILPAKMCYFPGHLVIYP